MKKLFVIVTLLIFSAGLFAQKITVDDAVILAADNNISLKQQKLSLDFLKKQKNASWNSASPSLTLSASYGGSQTGTNEAWSKGEQNKNDPALSATASVNIRLSPSLATSIRSARLSYEAGEISYESMVRSIELSVRKSFYNLIYSRENIAVQESALESAKQTYESNRAKYNQGRLSELDLLNAQYNYEKKLPALETLKQSYEIALDSFKQVLGIDLREKIELEGSLEEAADITITEDVIMMNLDDVPDVKKVQMNIEAAKNSLMATRFSAWGPSLSASASAVENVTNETLVMNYSLGLSIPLDGYLPWSSGALSIESQKTNLENLKLSLEDTKTSIAIKIRSSYNTITQAQTQLDMYEKNVTLMQRAYDMTLSAYNAGSKDLLSLQTAADNLATAKNTLQNQRYTIISAILELENLLGVPFGSLGTSEER
ncbi:MAG: TolC family protein [Treponema sp.]|nr:TolC family protein [Treponema sp.]